MPRLELHAERGAGKTFTAVNYTALNMLTTPNFVVHLVIPTYEMRINFHKKLKESLGAAAYMGGITFTTTPSGSCCYSILSPEVAGGMQIPNLVVIEEADLLYNYHSFINKYKLMAPNTTIFETRTID